MNKQLLALDKTTKEKIEIGIYTINNEIDLHLGTDFVGGGFQHG